MKRARKRRDIFVCIQCIQTHLPPSNDNRRLFEYQTESKYDDVFGHLPLICLFVIDQTDKFEKEV